VWIIRIPGRPNQGMPRSRGWAANPSMSYRSRDGPHLCSASPFTSPSTRQVSVHLFNEAKYSLPLETLHNKHPPYGKGPISLVMDFTGRVVDGFADGGKVHLRTGLKLCTCTRQAGRENLTTRHLPSALTPHATPKSLDQHIRNLGIAERYSTIPGFEPASLLMSPRRV
jgi:hypothetical protein